jgi:hypothetical protein
MRKSAHALVAALLAILPAAAIAQSPGDPSPADSSPTDKPLTAEAFEAIVEGKTMDTYSDSGWFGVETFLPGRRTIWRDADRCLHGTWREQDGMICYDYENGEGPFCSSFHDRGGWLLGWEDGIWGNDPILLYPSRDFVTCEGFTGV